MAAHGFWSSKELTIRSYKRLAQFIDEVFTKWEAKGRTFVWRGQVDAGWPLHSSLYRRLAWTRAGTPPEEHDLREAEGKILIEAHRWGLHAPSATGRLSVLRQLATMQHYGAPTRLIDVTFNPWIAAWFAVEQKWNNGNPAHESADARLFAIDVTDRLINEQDEHRGWEDELARPWPAVPDSATSDEDRATYRAWCTEVFAWRPSRLDSRIAAQDGGFLLGGVPASRGISGPVQWSKRDEGTTWPIASVRRATSVALHPHLLRTERGGVSQGAVYSFRIKAEAKQAIRARLEKHFNYRHSTIYPDFSGFASFGTPYLKSRPGD